MRHGELGSENVAFLWLRAVHGSVSFTGFAAVSEPSFGIPTLFLDHASYAKRTALVCERYYATLLVRILSFGKRALA